MVIMLNNLDKTSQNALKSIYKQFEKAERISVSSPDFKRTTIDYLVNQGLIEKMDSSTLTGWSYIVMPTHEGEVVFDEMMKSPLTKVETFIEEGETIMKEEYHPAEGGFLISYISGPKSDQWFNEIKIFNSRVLKSHPLYEQIADVCQRHNRLMSSHEDMMGYLKALAADDDFWMESEQKENKMGVSYDLFISHANKDKIEYVEQLKQSLDKLNINIFYDKDTIEWGDKWKVKILEGVAQAEFAIIVISENFFDREWTEKELNEFLHRQNSSGQKIILPILYGITTSQLKEKYPDVADIQALNSKDYSCDEIAIKFAAQLIKRYKL